MSTESEFDVLLFDLGGVLIDFAGFDELSRLLPGSPDRSEIRNRWIHSESVQLFERGGITPHEFARGVIGELELDFTPDDFIAAFVGWARGPYPGARSLLSQLHRTHRLACLSNSNELHTPLHRRSMEPLLDRYYFSDELSVVKPDREIFDHVIRDLRVPPERIAFFDDTPINVRAALGSGLIAFAVDGVSALETQLQLLGLLDPKPDQPALRKPTR
jgi:putative hydrolase of the HAD superfamily